MYLDITEPKEFYFTKSIQILSDSLSLFSRISARIDKVSDTYCDVAITFINRCSIFQQTSDIAKKVVLDTWNNYIKNNNIFIPISVEIRMVDWYSMLIRLNYNESVYYEQVAEYEVKRLLES